MPFGLQPPLSFNFRVLAWLQTGSLPPTPAAPFPPPPPVSVSRQGSGILPSHRPLSHPRPEVAPLPAGSAGLPTGPPQANAEHQGKRGERPDTSRQAQGESRAPSRRRQKAQPAWRPAGHRNRYQGCHTPSCRHESRAAAGIHK